MMAIFEDIMAKLFPRTTEGHKSSIQEVQENKLRKPHLGTS